MKDSVFTGSTWTNQPAMQRTALLGSWTNKLVEYFRKYVVFFFPFQVVCENVGWFFLVRRHLLVHNKQQATTEKCAKPHWTVGKWTVFVSIQIDFSSYSFVWVFFPFFFLNVVVRMRQHSQTTFGPFNNDVCSKYPFLLKHFQFFFYVASERTKKKQ